MAYPTVPSAARFAKLEVLDDAAGTNATEIAGIREFGALGGEANLVAVDQFGSTRQLQIAGQQSPTDFTTTYNWNGSVNQQAVFSAGATGSGTVTVGGATIDIAVASTYWRLTITDASASSAPNTTLTWQGGVAAANFGDIAVSAATSLNSSISINGPITIGTS